MKLLTANRSLSFAVKWPSLDRKVSIGSLAIGLLETQVMVISLLPRLWVQLVLVITCHNLRTTLWLLTCSSSFCGLAFVSSIFCSMNNLLEQYGISARVVRSLRETNAKKSSEEKSKNNNEQLPRNGNEIMTEAYSDCKKVALNNSLLKTGDSTKQDNVPISGSMWKKQFCGRNNYEKQNAWKFNQPWNIYLLTRIGYRVWKLWPGCRNFFLGCSASPLVDFVARYYW